MFELVGDMDKDQFGDLLSELDKKEWFSVYDANYQGTINERAYVTQATKGIFSGVVETKNSRAERSLTTFFEINYRNNSYRIWNSKKVELAQTTQNLNRVFRNKEIIAKIGDENLQYLADLAEFYKYEGEYYDYFPALSKSIKTSLFSGSEILYKFAIDMGYDSTRVGRENMQWSHAVVNIAREMRKSDIPVTYKNILKFLGLTKANIKDNFVSHTKFLPLLFSIGKYGYQPDSNFFQGKVNVDYSRGSITDNKGWSYTLRPILELLQEMATVSKQYGYATNRDELVHDIGRDSIQEINTLFFNIEEMGINLNIKKLASYLYIDVYKHQGISNFSATVNMYMDYLNLIKHYNKIVQYPKYLHVAHDIASKNYNSGAQNNSIIWDLTKKYAGIEGVYKVNDTKYPVVLMRTATEINEEATYQSNCLSSYVSNVVDGRSLILSLKNPNSYKDTGLLESWVSFELRVHEEYLELRQAYQTYNKTVDNDIMTVLKSILDISNVRLSKSVIGFYGSLKDIENVKAKKVGKLEPHYNPSTNEVDDAEVPMYLERL